jgi:hypothetical protein
LARIGPIDLVIFGWSCQGFSHVVTSQGFFQSQVKFILRIDSCCATFITITYAPMCIFVGECPTIGGL